MKRKAQRYMEDLEKVDSCQHIKQLQNGLKNDLYTRHMYRSFFKVP